MSGTLKTLLIFFCFAFSLDNTDFVSAIACLAYSHKCGSTSFIQEITIMKNTNHTYTIVDSETAICQNRKDPCRKDIFNYDVSLAEVLAMYHFYLKKKGFIKVFCYDQRIDSGARKQSIYDKTV